MRCGAARYEEWVRLPICRNETLVLRSIRRRLGERALAGGNDG